MFLLHVIVAFVYGVERRLARRTCARKRGGLCRHLCGRHDGEEYATLGCFFMLRFARVMSEEIQVQGFYIHASNGQLEDLMRMKTKTERRRGADEVDGRSWSERLHQSSRAYQAFRQPRQAMRGCRAGLHCMADAGRPIRLRPSDATLTSCGAENTLPCSSHVLTTTAAGLPRSAFLGGASSPTSDSLAHSVHQQPRPQTWLHWHKRRWTGGASKQIVDRSKLLSQIKESWLNESFTFPISD